MTGGPPISNREVLFLPSTIEYGISICIGILFLFIAHRLYQPNRIHWRVRILLTLGTVTIITSPWISTLHKAVIGAYPTIDKEGSLLFFEHGVHHLWFTAPEIPLNETGLTLIGIHVGHLWITELLHLFVPTFVAFNLQMMLHLGFNVLSVLFWLDGWESIKEKEWQKWVIAIVIGAQLHVFRDIHWYTIEKSALFPLFLFWGVLLRLYKSDGGTQNTLHWAWLPLCYGFAGLYNFYWAILLPFVSLAYTDVQLFNTKSKRLKGLMGCMVIGLLIGWAQLTLQSTEQYFANGSEFQQRASLDIFDVSTLDWNRMGFWKPLNPILVGMGLWVVIKKFREFKADIKTDKNDPRSQQISHFPISEWTLMLSMGAITTLLSMGPNITATIANPIYIGFQWLPGMWRFAKPEIFLLIPYAICARIVLEKEWNKWLWIALSIVYLVGLYLSTAFPYTTQFISGTLRY